MALTATGWILDKSAGSRREDPSVARALEPLTGRLFLCEASRLEYLYSARSATEYAVIEKWLSTAFAPLASPADVLERALSLQRDLANHRALWHRMPIPDLIVAETALYHGLGVVHVDSDYERIAEVRPLRTLQITPSR